MNPRLLDALTDINNQEAHRFLGMGFRLYDVRVSESADLFSDRIHARFQCICGRTEYWTAHYDPRVPADLFNVYIGIVRFGSTNRAHLLEDGFSLAQINDMEDRLRGFQMTPQIERRAWHDVRGLRFHELRTFSVSPILDTDSITTPL